MEGCYHNLLQRVMTRQTSQPNLWMQKTVDQIWEFHTMIWHCRNGELHRHNFEEQKQIALEVTQTTV